MSMELGQVPEVMVSVSSLYTVADHHHPPTVYSTVNKVSKAPEQPIYCNSQDSVTYSSVMLPEQTTSPTMHYSTITASQPSPSVNAAATLGHNGDDIIYSNVQRSEN